MTTMTPGPLLLVAEKIATVLSSAEFVSSANAELYEQLLTATADACDPRLNVTCFQPMLVFEALTQFIMYAQVLTYPQFSFVNLNQEVAQGVWGFAGWSQDLTGSRYYFKTDSNAHTDCYYPTDAENPNSLNLSIPDFGFDFNSINELYIQLPLTSASGESWTTVYPYNITGSNGTWSIDLFASYGVFNPSTGAITSVDIDLESIDVFMKDLEIDRDITTLFVVEVSTGTVIALSDQTSETRDHDSFTLNTAADHPLTIISEATNALGNLSTVGQGRNATFTIEDTLFAADAILIEGHTGISWVVIETTAVDLADTCSCPGSVCSCYSEDTDRVDLVFEEFDGILTAVQNTVLTNKFTFEVLQLSPLFADSSFDILTRFAMFSQIVSDLDFSFVNLNTNPAHGVWALNGWAADSGTQYFFDTDSVAATNCWFAENPNALDFSRQPDINFTTPDSNSSIFIQSPLTSSSGESWAPIYQWVVFDASGNSQTDLFASYGIYSSATNTISSADLDLTLLDNFVKKVGTNIAADRSNKASLLYVVEATTGNLLAISDPNTLTHDDTTIYSAYNNSNNDLVAALTTGYGTHLDDGVSSKYYSLMVNDVNYDVRTRRLEKYTSLDWVIIQAISTSELPSTTTTTTLVQVSGGTQLVVGVLVFVMAILGGICNV